MDVYIFNMYIRIFMHVFTFLLKALPTHKDCFYSHSWRNSVVMWCTKCNLALFPISDKTESCFAEGGLAHARRVCWGLQRCGPSANANLVNL